MYMHINETGQYHQRRSIHRKNTAPAGNTIPNGSGSITDQEMARAIALRILQYDVHSARPFHTNFFYHTMPGARLSRANRQNRRIFPRGLL